MHEIALYQLVVYIVLLLLAVKPLGLYIATVYGENKFLSTPVIGFLENIIYKACNIDSKSEMNWVSYLYSMLLFNLLGIIFVYVIQRIQFYLPLNPQVFPNIPPELAFNTAISFATNTDWRAGSSEDTLSYFTQMVGLTVQNFLSAATGISLLIALARGLIRQETSYLGNFWVDMTRCVLYILLPLSIISAVFLTSQGVIQNLKPYEIVKPLQYEGKELSIPMGPVASQVAISLLGSNGGGYFNANSAHPFENPNPLTNFFEMLSILLIPTALCYAFGCLIKDKRQGWALLIVMLIMFIPPTVLVIKSEQNLNYVLSDPNKIENHDRYFFTAGNMEGKETRFGTTSSAIWATATTASSNGSTNSAIISLKPVSILFSLWFIQLGEIVFGGVGTGLYSMLMLVIITVFIIGLIVGRTPEYLGKKIEPFEMKIATFAVMIGPLIMLFLTSIALLVGETSDVSNRSFTEVLYTFSSLVNNNGSGLNTPNSSFYNITGALAMLLGRYWIAIPALAIAGSLAKKKTMPSNIGTLPTYTGLFIVLLICVIVLVSALTFLPALALGPLVENIILWKQYGL
jgi:potassium-transporting ATPase potassium-binding subunit